MKMKKQLAIALSTFGVAALALGGSTFAWFQVANTANLGLGGTTAAVGDNLQVGFRFSEAAMGTTGFVANANAVGLVQNTIDLDGTDGFEVLVIEAPFTNLIDAAAMAAENNVFWAPNNITSEVMEFVTSVEGYVNNDILPVTSGSFDGATDVTLKSTPIYNSNRTDRIVPIDQVAPRSSYVGFQMVFRVASPADDISQDELPDGISNYGIYFDTGTSVVAANANVEEALRLSVKNRTLVTPSSKIIGIEKAAPGATNVGGRMDLNGDGVWDFTAGIPTVQSEELDSEGSVVTSEQIVFNKYEIVYGEFESALDNDNWNDTVTGGTEIAVPFSNQDFLDGESHKDVFAFKADVDPKTAAYDAIKNNTYGQIKIDENGDNLSGNPLADSLGVTDANGLVSLQMQFWLEGWDENTVNDVAGTAFGLYLSFIAVK